MAQLRQAKTDRLKALRVELNGFKRSPEKIHKKTGYEDLEHGAWRFKEGRTL